MIENEEFLIFLEHLTYYLTIEPTIYHKEDVQYPVGILKGEFGDVRIHFMHYNSFEEARRKWEERKQRVNFENLFVIMEPIICDEVLINRFEALPFKNKVIVADLTASAPHVFVLKKGFYSKSRYHWGKLLEYPKYGLKRYIERFDYVHFFNSGKIRKRLL